MAKPTRIDLPCSSGDPGLAAIFEWEPQDGTDADVSIMLTDPRGAAMHYITKESARELFNWLGAMLHR